ncbi:Uncharacterized protein CTYZ_00001498 [Cryptosporidium tyzzeri]|nr:Uncharacterized protein CTYZ_00001498 [Cryptosporidium tyzzeri]
MIFLLTCIYLFGITLLEFKVNAQNILDDCVKAGLASYKRQNVFQKFRLRLDVSDNISKYENFLKNYNTLDENISFMDEEYLQDISRFLFDRNEILIDYFWDSMMDSLPPTWHVYGIRPIQASIIRTRFMESCVSNIYSLYKEGKIEKFHTIIPNLRDARYLTSGKVNEICRNIKGKIENFGFEIPPVIKTIGRSNLPVYYRCSEIQSDELADVTIFILDKKIPKFNIPKQKICEIVNVMIREPASFHNSCFGVLSFGLRGYLPIDNETRDSLDFACKIMDNIRKYTRLFSKEPIQMPNKNIKYIIVESLLRIYSNIELTGIGMEIVEQMKISEYRFIESCTNFSETLFALQGFKIIEKQVSKQNGMKTNGSSDEQKEEEDKEIDNNIANPFEEDPRDLRKKLLLACSGIHMHLFEIKPKGVSFTKLINSRIIVQEDFSKVSKSKLLYLDLCDNKNAMILDKHSITQDTLAEIILSAILHSSSKSMSSIALYNGFVKEYICSISGEIISSLRNHFETFPKFEETGFMNSCRQTISEEVFPRQKEKSMNFMLKKSIIKLCSIVVNSLSQISQLLNSNSSLDNIKGQDDDELTSSEYLSEEI